MAHGVVHWEIGVRDGAAQRVFYRAVFGWETSEFGEGYGVVQPDDGIGGGLMTTPPGVPPYVTFYVAVDDLEATLATVKDHGGEVVVGPTPIPGVGAFAMFRDPEGNAIGILRPEPGEG